MFEPDPSDAAFDGLLKVRTQLCLIVTSWPGQSESEPHPAPTHIRQQMLAGHQLPFIRETKQQELEKYALEHKLFSTALTAYLTV